MSDQPPKKRIRLQRIVIEVREKRKATYEKAAEIQELHVSEWCRRVLDEAAKKVIDDDTQEKMK